MARNFTYESTVQQFHRLKYKAVRPLSSFVFKRRSFALNGNYAQWPCKPLPILRFLIWLYPVPILQDKEINRIQIQSLLDEIGSAKEALLKTGRESGRYRRRPPVADGEVGLLWLLAPSWKYCWLLWSYLRQEEAGCRFLLSLFLCQWGLSPYWDLFLLLPHCLVKAILGGMRLLTLWRGTPLLVPIQSHNVNWDEISAAHHA